MNIVKQKSSDKVWTDENGTQVQYSRTTKVERLMETSSYKIATKAVSLHKKLADFKQELAQLHQEAYECYLQENNIDAKDRKGNFSWFNFDRSIKVEGTISERIEFDEMAVKASKELLYEFLSDNVQSEDEMIKEMVMSAFETTNGRLDTKRVFSLIRYKSKIKNKKFHHAVGLLENGIRRPDSKIYFRTSLKNADGKYEAIDLNFSSI